MAGAEIPAANPAAPTALCDANSATKARKFTTRPRSAVEASIKVSRPVGVRREQDSNCHSQNHIRLPTPERLWLEPDRSPCTKSGGLTGQRLGHPGKHRLTGSLQLEVEQFVGAGAPQVDGSHRDLLLGRQPAETKSRIHH